MQNDARPRISVQPGTVPPFVNGGSLFNLITKIYHFDFQEGQSFGFFLDLHRRDVNGVGIKRTEEEAELLSEEEGCEVWRKSFHLYRRGSSSTARFWVVAWLGPYGQIYCPLDLDVTGDSVVDDAAPELLPDWDWCTKGENPIYLDLYPLWGRSAATNIYANVVLKDDTAIDPSRLYFFVDNPICIEDTSIPFGFTEHFKGDCVEGSWRTDIYFRNDINWKHWNNDTRLKLKLMVCDIFGQEAIYDLGDICLYGKTDVEVDCEKPDGLWNVLINDGAPVTVVKEEESQFFFQTPVSLWASDAGKGIDSVSLSYRSPSGNSNFSTFIRESDLVEGTCQRGRFVSTASLSVCAEAGIYCLSSISIVDKAGNRCSFFNEQALEKWLATNDPDGTIQRKITVINPDEDFTPPEMAGPLIFKPAFADITVAPANLNVSVDLKDVGCGLSTVSLELIHCEDPSAPSIFIFLQRGFEGDDFMRTYSGMALIEPGTKLGQYAPRLQVSDRANNRSIFGAPFPGSFGIETLPLFEGSTEKVTIVSELIKQEDLTPPQLLTGVWDCSFDFKDPGGYVTLTFSAQDLESGLDLGFGFGGIGGFDFGRGGNWVELLDPKGIHDQFVQLTQQNFDFENNPESNEFNATFKVMFFLPKGVKPSDYCFRIQLTNKCGVSITYGLGPGETLFPVDFPTECTIINTGPVDCTPPVPVFFEATPEFVQSGENLKLNICIRITDGLTEEFGTGFQSAFLEVKSGLTEHPQLPGFFSRPVIASTTILPPGEQDGRSEGTIYDFTFKWEVDLVGGAFSGDFLSFCLDVRDCANNSRTYDTSICNFNFQAYPLPCDLAQLAILAAYGENDFKKGAVFKVGTPPELRVWNADADGDGLINLFEVILGTDPSDPNSLFRVVLRTQPPIFAAKSNSNNPVDQPRTNASHIGDELRVDFSPYNPVDLIYTLYNVFEGEDNDERVPIAATPMLDEATGDGYFLLPLNTEGLNTELVAVGADDPDFVP